MHLIWFNLIIKGPTAEMGLLQKFLFFLYVAFIFDMVEAKVTGEIENLNLEI